jgi:hypothetical protein
VGKGVGVLVGKKTNKKNPSNPSFAANQVPDDGEELRILALSGLVFYGFRSRNRGIQS